MSSFIVYGLIDPRTKLIRYIGKSCNGLSRPKKVSVYLRGRSYCKNWIRELCDLGLSYEIIVLSECDSDPLLLTEEIWWIAYGRACGWPLTNLTSGGEGAAGVKQSVDNRRKKSEAALGRSVPLSVRERISATLTGRTLPASQVIKMRERRASIDTRTLMSAGIRRSWIHRHAERQQWRIEICIQILKESLGMI